MNNLYFSKLKEFIEEIRWKYPFELNRDTQIERDLKITGDDAVEFIISFGEKFDVDVSNFMADEYFEPEGLDVISFFLKHLFSNKTNKKVLTLGDLEKAIKCKKLQ